jgi:Chaperone of endosialidase
MKIARSLAVGITSLVLTLWIGPTWGATPDTPSPIFVDDENLHNTAGGLGALESNDGRLNTAFGTHALQNNTTGSQNTAVGADALQHNQPLLGVGGSANTAVGSQALMFNRDGIANTAVGADALVTNTTGRELTAIGQAALFSNSDGQSNTAIGRSALSDNTTGSNNTATGKSALIGNTTGEGNTANGVNSLFSNTAGCPVVVECGDNNTAIGFNALLRNTTGSDNTALGEGAGQNLLSGNNNIYLRAFAGGTPFGDTTVQESDTMRLGRNQMRTFIDGIAGVNVSGDPVVISNTGQLGTQPSSGRYKEDIETMGTSSQGLFQLRPVTFRYKNNEDVQGGRQYGLIAEEVAKVYPELVTRDVNGEGQSVRYQALIPMLLNELQHQHRQLGAQAEQLTLLEAANEQLRAMVAQQKERDEVMAARLERLERLEAAAAHAPILANR